MNAILDLLRVTLFYLELNHPLKYTFENLFEISLNKLW